jgi:DNA recombination protein RmuC
MLVLTAALSLFIGALVTYAILNWRLSHQIEKHVLVIDLRQQVHNYKSELNEARSQKETLLQDLSSCGSTIKQLNEKLTTQQHELMETKHQLTQHFEQLASKILEEKSSQIVHSNREQIDLILSPLKEKINAFENKVERVYQAESSQRIQLKVELEKLTQLNNQLSSDANNLAMAIKGDNRQQGAWGEMLLENLLEQSGLIANQNYIKQYQDIESDGNRIRPDIVINLPDQRHIVIDSKVSLKAYSDYTASQDENERVRLLQLHLNSLKSHIKLLSEKNYTQAKNLNTLEFILLFIPIEGALSAAISTDAHLFRQAWDKNIVIVSPTTLMSTLITIANIWKQENRSRNAEEIALEAGKLYDKFVGLLEDITQLGNHINKLQDEYSQITTKLKTGKGNLIGRIDKLKILGAKTTKSITSNWKEKESTNLGSD